MHQPNNFEIYRTSPECCKAHFSSSSTCLQDSKDSHAPFPFPSDPRQRPYSPGDRPVRWFPDLINKLNCVNGINYENWMTTEGYGPYYLFTDSTLCCQKWYDLHTNGYICYYSYGVSHCHVYSVFICSRKMKVS